MKVIQQNSDELRLQHWKRNARLWAFLCSMSIILLCIIEYIYPRVSLSCVQHPNQNAGRGKRVLTSGTGLWKARTSLRRHLEEDTDRKQGNTEDPESSTKPSEDVDCVMDRWVWSLNPFVDSYMIKHEQENFELVSVELIKETKASKKSIYDTSTSSTTTTSTTVASSEDDNPQPAESTKHNSAGKNGEDRTQYSVFLKSQTPERKHRLGTYASLEWAKNIYQRIEKFLEETKGVNDSSLRLDLDQDNRLWVFIALLLSCCTLVYLLWRPSFEELMFDRKHSTVVLSQRNIVGYVRQARTSTLEYISKARAKRIHVYAVGRRFDFRLKEHSEYAVEIVAADDYGQEEVIRLGLGDLLHDAREAKEIASTVNKWMMMHAPLNYRNALYRPVRVERTFSGDAEAKEIDDFSLAQVVGDMLSEGGDEEPENVSETDSLLASPSSGQEDTHLNGSFSEHTCVICRRNQRSTVLLPCRHLCLCAKCARTASDGSRLKHCPMCRNPITLVLPVFSS
eukprot:gb/GECG01005271.1/.p1 GENE.gb/GECG01005271.1/~~gb/GECG01005271.1/.p1  ORF type:complete len:510 (+),score=56.42 gb/GECG01005271.1/:1-1530(+)